MDGRVGVSPRSVSGDRLLSIGRGGGRVLMVKLATEGGRKGIEELLRLARGPRQRGMDSGPRPEVEDRRALHREADSR